MGILIIKGSEGMHMKKYDIEDLYWEDWDELVKNQMEIDNIFAYIKDFDSRNDKELGQILQLYSNPSGSFTNEFASIVAEIYKYDRIKFIKALRFVKDETSNIVYVLRNLKVFENEDHELSSILESGELDEEEIEVAKDLFQMYKKVCVS